MRPNNVFLAAICRNHTRKITHAWIDVDVNGDSLWAKTKVGLFAISNACDASLDSIIFEGDTLQVIDPIQNSASSPHWSISNIINNINVIALSFSCYLFSHVLRSVNGLAHFFPSWAPFL